MKAGAKGGKRDIEIPCKVSNFLAAPGEGLPAALRFPATFAPIADV